MAGGLPADWALDFRNVIVEVGPSALPGTRNPRHFQRGVYDGKRFGFNEITQTSAKCISLDDPSKEEEILAEYLRPCKPDGPGQVVIVITQEQGLQGSQKTTSYLNDGQWMMELDPGEVTPVVISEDSLCRIWKV